MVQTHRQLRQQIDDQIIALDGQGKLVADLAKQVGNLQVYIRRLQQINSELDAENKQLRENEGND
ncbi:hypothetical protein LCGC14_2309310 [marine sediment metagenome]|uniref:Uncharacterized protein n=1 Tax=marine sediment metagenome TaxID=412755 RepID=A0A0F9CLM3_9ZZZZ